MIHASVTGAALAIPESVARLSAGIAKTGGLVGIDTAFDRV